MRVHWVAVPKAMRARRANREGGRSGSKGPSRVQREAARLARMMHGYKDEQFGVASVSCDGGAEDEDGVDLFSRGGRGGGANDDDGQRRLDASRRKREKRTAQHPNAGWRENGKGRH
jgi:hypothetical protein